MADLPLFDWQQRALTEAEQRMNYGLFSDPGTGKTYCALRIAQKWTPRAVVVCPLSVKKQWAQLAESMGYELHVYHYEQLRNKEHFGGLHAMMDAFACTLILDESHRIKSPSTVTTKAALKLAPIATHRLALTGTPTANSPADLYTQFKFLKPAHRMGTYREFQEEYIECLPASHPLYKRIAGRPFLPRKNRDGTLVLKNIDKLKKRVAEYGITVRLEDVVELPERTFVQRICKAVPELMKAYKLFAKNYTAQFRTKTLAAANAAVLAGRLTRLTSGLGHADFEIALPNPKLTVLLEEIDTYVAVGKVIVWSVWVDERKAAAEALRAAGYRVTDTPDELISGAAQIFVGSPKMFGTGLNLQCAKYQLWLSRSWSLLEREQGLARNYRAGQTDKTVVVDYLTDGTIDFNVLSCLETKTDLLNRIMTTGEL